VNPKDKINKIIHTNQLLGIDIPLDVVYIRGRAKIIGIILRVILARKTSVEICEIYLPYFLPTIFFHSTEIESILNENRSHYGNS